MLRKNTFLNKFDHVALFQAKMTGNHLSPSCQSPLRPLCGHSPQTPREPSGTGVDAALPLDELIQRFGIRLVGRRIPQDSAPLAPGPLICLGGISGAPNSRGERAAHSPSRSPGHEADCEGVDGDHRECTECVDRREAEKTGNRRSPLDNVADVCLCLPPPDALARTPRQFAVTGAPMHSISLQ